LKGPCDPCPGLCFLTPRWSRLSAHTKPASTGCSIQFVRILIWRVSSTGTGAVTLGRGVGGKSVPSGQCSRLHEGADETQH
jgi:hypothetical protein